MDAAGDAAAGELLKLLEQYEGGGSGSVGAVPGELKVGKELDAHRAHPPSLFSPSKHTHARRHTNRSC